MRAQAAEDHIRLAEQNGRAVFDAHGRPTFRRSIPARAPETGSQSCEITGSHELDDVISELGIVVEPHVSKGAGKRGFFQQLLQDSVACWVARNVEMQNAPAIVFNREEAIQAAEPKGRWRAEP